MKTAVLFGFTLLAIAPAFAQTTSQSPGDPAIRTVTLTGCVGGGSESTPITLSNALIIPGTSQPGQPDPSGSNLPPASSTTTQPGDPTLPPPTAAPVPSAAAATGTSGAASPTGTSGTKTPAPSSSAATGVVTGTAPAGSSSSSVTGYRLSGADMQPWIGKRVQIIGTFVPAAPPATPSAANPPTVTGASAIPPPLEFRVQTVQPTTGSCPKQ
jgi:hypothetical protein